MTAFNLISGTARRERVSFVPTTFFAEFAGVHGLGSESSHDAYGHTKHHLVRGDIAPALPSKGR